MGSAATIGGTTGGTTGGTDGGGSTTTPQPAQLPASPLAATFTTVPALRHRRPKRRDPPPPDQHDLQPFQRPGDDHALRLDRWLGLRGRHHRHDGHPPQPQAAPGASKGTDLKFVYPTGIDDGSYDLIASASATATNTAPAVAVTSNPVAIAAPKVDLSTTFASAEPIRINTAGLTTTAVTIRNEGNVTATGMLGLNLYASADPTLDIADTLLATLPIRKIRLRPGQSLTLRVPFSDRLVDAAGHLLPARRPGRDAPTA